jgi:ribonuclease P protein component
MSQSFTLGRDQRCKSRKLIEKIFKQGKSFSLFPFRVFYLHDDGVSQLQAGFGASSRNFKKAVDRNRIKRLTREAYRLQRPVLSQRLGEKGQSLALFFIYTGKELPDYATVSGKMGVILQKLIKELGP